MTTDVKFYLSSMTGAPSLSGTNGALVALLDACLINGFNLVSVGSISISGGVATVTVSAGHGFELHQVVLIAGATPSGLNGEQRVTEVLSTTQFTFDTTEEDGSASGTITAKAAPVGDWEIAYTATNKRSYRSTQLGATGFYLLVVDDGSHISGARTAKVRGYRAMSDTSDAGTGPFPTAAQASAGWTAFKSYLADSSTVTWALVGDGKLFYLVMYPRQTTYERVGAILVFGDIESYRVGDGYQCVLVALNPSLTSYTVSPGTACDWGALNSSSLTDGQVLALPYNAIGDPPYFFLRGDPMMSYSGDGTVPSSAVTYPAPIDNGLWYTDLVIKESADVFRGALPGAYAPMHSKIFTNLQIVEGLGAMNDRAMLNFDVGRSGSWSNSSITQTLMDITGPWRA